MLTITARRSGVDEVEITVAERPTGSFSRQVFLGETLDVDKLRADYRDGSHSGDRKEIVG